MRNTILENKLGLIVDNGSCRGRPWSCDSAAETGGVERGPLQMTAFQQMAPLFKPSLQATVLSAVDVVLA